MNCRKLSAHALILSLLAVATLSLGSAFAGEIPWCNTQARNVASQAESSADVLARVAAQPLVSHAVIQFEQPVSDTTRAALERAGVHLLSYLSDNAFFVAVDANVDADAVAQLSNLAGISDIPIAAKLHPRLVADTAPHGAIVQDSDDPIIGAYVAFHRDVNLDTEGTPLMDLYGAVVRDTVESINTLVIELPLSAARGLAAEDAVQWIEPALPRFAELNDSNRDLTQANEAQESPYNLDGTGITVLVYDAGSVRASHDDFGGRVIVGPSDSSGMADHATHVAGTIGGDGISSGGTYRGMAPNCDMISYGYEWDDSGVFLYNNPGDLENDYASAIYFYGAEIANNSIGTNTALYWDCDITGDYGLTSSLIDGIVRGSASNGTPFRVIWANGNERQTSNCGSYYNTTAPPAGAKNHITVGSVDSDTDSSSDFTSWGPVDDGRMKPDISAPGCQAGGDAGVTSCSYSGDSAYTTKCGTSMATPTVTGLCALMLQDFKAQFPGESLPRNSTLKILLAHTAADRGNDGPDNVYGYGSVRVVDAIDFQRLGQFAEADVSNGSVVKYHVTVQSGDELKVTLAWDDAPATPNVAVALVNDLDLRLIDPTGGIHYPWTLNPSDPGAPAMQTQPNTIDNIEQVYITSPAAGEWTIEVAGTAVPEGPQIFSICASAPFERFGIELALPAGVPTEIVPGASESIDVQIATYGETLVSNSVTLHCRYDDGAWLDIPLQYVSDNLYNATLPPPVCGSNPQFYFSAAGTTSGTTTNPLDAPASYYGAVVGEELTYFFEDMENDPNWIIGAADDDATAGIWELGDPEGTSAQPGDDHTDAPGVLCYATDPRGGTLAQYDVDGGQTTLMTPAIDLASIDSPRIGYWRWYSNDVSAFPNQDVFVVDISNDDGENWVNVETIGPDGAEVSGGWYHHEFDVGALLSLATNMRLRFIASDEINGSIIEAAIDDFAVTGFQCSAELDDCNENGIVDSDDIAAGRSLDANSNDIPDECEQSVGCLGDIDYTGTIDLSDLQLLLSNYGTLSGATFDDGDLDDNGTVDLSDLQLMLSAYGTNC